MKQLNIQFNIAPKKHKINPKKQKTKRKVKHTQIGIQSNHLKRSRANQNESDTISTPTPTPKRKRPRKPTNLSTSILNVPPHLRPTVLSMFIFILFDLFQCHIFHFVLSVSFYVCLS